MRSASGELDAIKRLATCKVSCRHFSLTPRHFFSQSVTFWSVREPPRLYHASGCTLQYDRLKVQIAVYQPPWLRNICSTLCELAHLGIADAGPFMLKGSPDVVRQWLRTLRVIPSSSLSSARFGNPATGAKPVWPVQYRLLFLACDEL